MTEKAIDDSTLYQRKEVLSTQVDDDLILFDEAQGRYFTTSAVGAAIWDMLAEPTSVKTLCNALLSNYEVEPETCETEVLTFLEMMDRNGLMCKKSTERP